MNFLAPELLIGLAIIPVAIAAYILIQRRRSQYAVRFTNLALLANIAPRRPGWRRHLPPAIYLAAIAALLVGLARPTVVMATPREDATVVLAIDVSGSMAATDVSPTRLDAAKAAAEQFLSDLPKGIRVALISFSNQPVTLVTPTVDRDTVRAAIEGLQPQQGTALGDAVVRIVDIAEAVRNAAASDGSTAPSASSAPRASTPPAASAAPGATPAPSGSSTGTAGTSLVAGILLSDGAQSVDGTQPIPAARTAAQYSVPIYTIALGTDSGTISGLGRNGQRVSQRVPPDPATLASIAEITGAATYTAPTADDLKGVYSDLQSRIGYVNRDQEVTAYLAGGGVVLVLTGALLAALWFGRLP